MQTAARLWRLCLNSLRRNGLRGNLERWWYARWERQCEQQLGIQTAACVTWRELGLTAASENYEPVDYQLFERLLQQWPVEPGRSVFLDYGSGKGRALVLASRHPFARVTGVELSADLCQVARHNAAVATGSGHRAPIEVLQSDATLYEPPADVSHVFLFNPFYGEVLAAVLQRLHESWQKSPREMTIAYVFPAKHAAINQLDQQTWLRPVRHISTAPKHELHCTLYAAQAGQ